MGEWPRWKLTISNGRLETASSRHHPQPIGLRVKSFSEFGSKNLGSKTSAKATRATLSWAPTNFTQGEKTIIYIIALNIDLKISIRDPKFV